MAITSAIRYKYNAITGKLDLVTKLIEAGLLLREDDGSLLKETGGTDNEILKESV